MPQFDGFCRHLRRIYRTSDRVRGQYKTAFVCKRPELRSPRLYSWHQTSTCRPVRKHSSVPHRQPFAVGNETHARDAPAATHTQAATQPLSLGDGDGGEQQQQQARPPPAHPSSDEEDVEDPALRQPPMVPSGAPPPPRAGVAVQCRVPVATAAAAGLPGGATCMAGEASMRLVLPYAPSDTEKVRFSMSAATLTSVYCYSKCFWRERAATM